MSSTLDAQKLITDVVSKLQGSKADGKLVDAWFIVRVILDVCMKVPALAKDKELLKKQVNELIDKLLKGADNIQGTADDLITPETAAKIRTYVNDASIDAVVSIVNDAMAGDLMGAGAQVVKMGFMCCSKPSAA